MEGIKTIKVVNDLELEIKGRSVTITGGIFGRREIGIAGAELPALLCELETAAGEMGIPTVQASLLSDCKALLEAFEGYEMLAALPIGIQEKARQDIAKAEQ